MNQKLVLLIFVAFAAPISVSAGEDEEAEDFDISGDKDDPSEEVEELFEDDEKEQQKPLTNQLKPASPKPVAGTGKASVAIVQGSERESPIVQKFRDDLKNVDGFGEMASMLIGDVDAKLTILDENQKKIDEYSEKQEKLQAMIESHNELIEATKAEIDMMKDSLIECESDVKFYESILYA